ncbi:non-homologous end joining protein Ku [Streptomyces sp. NPDC003758]|uniref:Non-homologous end joining protein Ku n=1 Tax=Streptomyces cynarae TaxID=2981134 RepID=A0ABY6EAH5_9ACTN|nr:Ku protein [Streptomyces cynarae]UXY23580.1 Ku protein [Streptomyces cynarae]
MPRSIWSGAISFGLVTIPVNVVPATEDHSVRFHQYHLEDMGRVRVRKYCELEDREVPSEEIGKGYELSRERVVPVLDEELRELPLPTAKAIEIAAFVPAGSIDPLRIGEGYYLQASGTVAGKPYALLRKALERTSKVAVAKFAWHGRERLGLLRVRDEAIVLHAMRWPDEIRDPGELAPQQVRLSDDEITEAEHLIDRMTREDLQGPDFVDHYTEALEQVIEARREGQAPPEMPEPEAGPGKVLDLMTALQASVAQAKASRGEETEAEVHELPEKKADVGRAAKKEPAEKTAAKKTAGKKTTKKPAAKTAPKAGAQSAARKDTAQKKTAAKGAAAKKTAEKTAEKRTARRPRSA